MISIWAPHPDDEIIGCYTLMQVLHIAAQPFEVLYGLIATLDCSRAALEFGFEGGMLDWDGNRYDATGTPQLRPRYDIVYAPDPQTEHHPDHQVFGRMAQQMFRDKKIRRLIHYSVNMQAHYICEVPKPQHKKEALDVCYPENADLWRFDHKYFLFEGYWEFLGLTNHNH